MALASSSVDYNLLNKKDDKNSKKKLSNESTSSKSTLDFYESMYHFKKMFPKFDSDVIEAVLRSNNGDVDKTVDQLLTMNCDNELAEPEQASNCVRLPSTDFTSSSTLANYQIMSDLPPSYSELPSYNEFMSSKKVSSQTVQIEPFESADKDKPISVTLIQETVSTETETKSKEERSDSIRKVEPQLVNLNEEKKSSLISDSDDSKPLQAKLNRISHHFNNIIIGELAKDFLRVKLTGEQVKKIKSTIKVAKRNELTAILNNKTPEKPDLSREIKKKLSLLNEQLEPSDDEEDEAWKGKYKDVAKTYEKRRQQIIQDEYLAKLIQNEEFLNELKTNRDFIDTLNYGKLIFLSKLLDYIWA